MAKPLLVFDLDGTLVDSAHDLMGTLNHVLASCRIAPLPLESARSLLGAGARALLRRGFAVQGVTLDDMRLEQLFSQFISHYSDHIADKSPLFPGALAALDALEAEGFRFAVCTNKLETLALKLLTALKVEHRFAAICGQDSCIINGKPVQKPDARALFYTIQCAGGDTTRAIMIGDSKTDIDTAKAANLPVIAVDFGYTDRPVHEFFPDKVIPHFDTLPHAVNQLVAHLDSNHRRA